MHSILYLNVVWSFAVIIICSVSVPTRSMGRQDTSGSRIPRQEPSLPSNLPSPKPPTLPSPSVSRPTATGTSTGRQGGNGANLFGRVPALPPPQNQPPPPPGPLAGPLPPIPEVPFGLNHIILILVPQVKLRMQKMPSWLASNLKLSFPITIFFDKLDIPLGVRPFPFRGKRDTSSLTLNDTMHGAERAVLIPKLEKLLYTYGLEGKPCLLRAICEVHESPLNKTYGFLGEILTLVFSISRSVFAESHLIEHLQAEQMGKTRNCSRYQTECMHSMFT